MLLIYVMAKTKQTHKTSAAMNVLTIRLDADLERELTDAVTTTKLSRSDLARMSMERGLRVLLTQLSTPVPPTDHRPLAAAA